MWKLNIILCSVMLQLISAGAENDVISNDVIIPESEKNLTELELLSSPYLPYLYRGEGEKEKVVNIVVNPIIHNVAHGQGYNTGVQNDKPQENPPPQPNPPDQLLADVIRVFFRKTRFLTRFVLNGAGALVRAIIRFIMCTFVPICGVFGVFGDEMVETSESPEVIARGLDLLQVVIEKYHSTHNTDS